jgi:ferredoxin-thioredoxin reductase catalytic subunit
MDLEIVKKNIKEGWRLNENEKIVNGIIKGLNRNGGECPCANDSDDKHCPCSNYREHDHCCCTLYVKEKTE